MLELLDAHPQFSSVHHLPAFTRAASQTPDMGPISMFVHLALVIIALKRTRRSG